MGDLRNPSPSALRNLPEGKQARNRAHDMSAEQTKNSKWRAWTAGEDAYARGSALTDNPYRGFNEYLAKQWDSGWISAANPPTPAIYHQSSLVRIPSLQRR